MNYVVRYGAMRLLGIFSLDGENVLPMGTHVILRTARGQEAGVVLCVATEDHFAQADDFSGENRILRTMTKEDMAEHRRILKEEKNEFQRCRSVIERMKTQMDLVRIEHLFGGERIIVYYVAEGRVDFRELVKVLASEFQTRIEMRQIGVRDETKLLADFGDCGREVCCNTYLIDMPPVSMKMAKLQKATLDPTKISGRCGRLKCCLRYEYDTYVDLLGELPDIGRRVETPEGCGKVVAHEILPQKAWIEFEDRTRKLLPLAQMRCITEKQSRER